jgi:hypothetical protein
MSSVGRRAGNRSPISAEDLAPLLGMAFVTHGHGDHFNRKAARVLAEKGRFTFVIPAKSRS